MFAATTIDDACDCGKSTSTEKVVWTDRPSQSSGCDEKCVSVEYDDVTISIHKSGCWRETSDDWIF